MFEGLGRIILTVGGILIFIGIIFTLLGRFIPLGKLPGDIIVRRKNFVFYFPVVTMVVISLLLTLFFNLLRR